MVSGDLPPAEELIRLMERDGLTQEEIAVRYGVTRQAVSAKVRRYLKSPSDEKLLPWSVAREHRDRNLIVRSATAYAKWQLGRKLTDSELREARKLEDVANELGAVLIYTRARGFQWRARRGTDVGVLAAE